MRVLIDSNGLQARVHAQDGRRLSALLERLETLPQCAVRFSAPGPLTAAALRESDVLVVTTRRGEECAYTEEELAHIPAWVRRGGGLLLMSGHGDIPGRPYPDMTKHDAQLARKFGIEIENSFFASPVWGQLVELSGESLLASHPIISGGARERPVRSLVTRNCCSIICAAGAALVSLTKAMVDYRNGLPAQCRHFAVALDAGAADAADLGGRVVVVANSGLIGTEGTQFPGLGLIEKGDNRIFLQNAVSWLANLNSVRRRNADER
jgi:hypothetical protein